jgi:hypothetical protein
VLFPIAVNVVLCLIVFAVVVGGLAWAIVGDRPQPMLRVVRVRPRPATRRVARRPA